MPRYARIIDGYAIDVYDADSAAMLEKRLGVTGFIVVPPETMSYATVALNQNGSVASVVNYVPKPVDVKIGQRAALAAKLAVLDAVIPALALEAWAKINGTPDVQAKIAEKEQIITDLAGLG